ncbi:hypothetical protein IE4803_PD00183 (plasmid) [Rhizobium etli bv. phaseoli str. IE4803]|nr:hypothetical protein IE4803_PD00183 [Rhizobium etli bv. phaseoli str. IE4803]
MLPDFGRELEFSGVMAQFGGDAGDPFISEIGTLLPIALCSPSAVFAFEQAFFATRVRFRRAIRLPLV